MIQALTILHMIISVLLIIAVLLQFGRGAEAGFFSDTSSQGVFAGPGPANILTKLTTFLAILFLGLALVLANLRGKDRAASVFDDEVPQVLETTPQTTPGKDKTIDGSKKQSAPPSDASPK